MANPSVVLPGDRQIFIILANLVFGALIGGLPSIHLPPMGLVAAIYALTLVCLPGG